MGYTVDFDGTFKLDKPLTDEHWDYLSLFSENRHIKRDPVVLQALIESGYFGDKRHHEQVGLPLGPEGGYFVDGQGLRGQAIDESVIDSNSPPAGQPDVWCHWMPVSDDEIGVWEECEFFPNFDEWLEYIITHFLAPWGYVLNGEVYWSGQEPSDLGLLEVKDNVLTVKTGRIVYE